MQRGLYMCRGDWVTCLTVSSLRCSYTEAGTLLCLTNVEDALKMLNKYLLNQSEWAHGRKTMWLAMKLNSSPSSIPNIPLSCSTYALGNI